MMRLYFVVMALAFGSGLLVAYIGAQLQLTILNRTIILATIGGSLGLMFDLYTWRRSTFVVSDGKSNSSNVDY